MVRPAAMQKLQVVGLQSDREEMLGRLQLVGDLHVENISERSGALGAEKEHLPGYGATAADLLARMEWIEDFFACTAEPLRKSLAGTIGEWVRPLAEKPVKVERLAADKLLIKAEKEIAVLEKACLELDKRLAGINERKNALCGKKAKIENLKVLGVPLRNLKSGPATRVAVGLIPKETDISKALPKPHYFWAAEYDTERRLVAIIVMKEQAQELDSLLKQNGFVPLPVEGEKTPAEELRTADAEIARLEREATTARKEAQKLGREWAHRLAALKEQVRIEKERADQYHRLVRTGTAFVIEGWAPKSRMSNVLDAVNGFGQRTIVKVSDPLPEETERVPTLQVNNRYVRPFERLLQMFGLPAYNAWDPTCIMALFYPVFFGIMMGDAGYGSLFLIIALVLYYGKGKYDPAVRDFGFILGLGSTVAIIAGFMFGSLFGNIFPWFTPLWMDPTKDPMPLLKVALGLGLLHLNVGLLFGFAQNVANKDYRKAIGGQGGWMLFETGAILLALSLSGFAAGRLLGLLFIAVAAGVLAKLNGPHQLIGLVGSIGNWISYARIMALSLSGANIAATFNLLCGMAAGIPYIGTAVWLPLLLLAQTFAFVMCLPGAAIHSLRLHFVEFFDKFYEAGGREYEPFTITRLHTTI